MIKGIRFNDYKNLILNVDEHKPFIDNKRESQKNNYLINSIKCKGLVKRKLNQNIIQTKEKSHKNISSYKTLHLK